MLRLDKENIGLKAIKTREKATMQVILFALLLLIVGIIAVGTAWYLIRSGNAQRREQQESWYRHPRILAGIGLLILAVGQFLNALFSVSPLSNRLSPYIDTLFHAIGDISSLLCFVLFLFAIWLHTRSRQPGDEEPSPSFKEPV